MPIAKFDDIATIAGKRYRLFYELNLIYLPAVPGIRTIPQQCGQILVQTVATYRQPSKQLNARKTNTVAAAS